MKALFPALIAAILCTFSPGRLSAQQVRLEAEDAQTIGPSVKAVIPAAATQAGVATNPNPATGYSGTGYVSGLGDPANRLVFTYASRTNGPYDLEIGFRCPRKCAYKLAVNDLGITGSFLVKTPGAFEVQQAGKVQLKAGANTLTLERGWGDYDIDYIALTPSAPLTPPAAVNTPPSDPNATAEARALLSRLEQQYGKGALMGVYSDKDADYVLQATGVRPAIMGADLSGYSPSDVQRASHPIDIVERMIAHGQQGYLLTFSWHWVPPFGLLNRMIPGENGKPPVDARYNRGFYTNATNFDVSIAMDDPQSLERQLLLRDIDAIAVQLRKLQDAHLPVLFRPLHEASGGWFWWGAHGSQPFVQLWQLLYDRLVRVDGIHNLVWVYTSADDLSWYPGDAYADMIGVDAYPEDLRDPQSEVWTLLSTEFAGRKLVTLSEFGGVPDVAKMRQTGVNFSYAVSWNGSEGPRKNDPSELKRIYTDPSAIKGPICWFVAAASVPGCPTSTLH